MERAEKGGRRQGRWKRAMAEGGEVEDCRRTRGLGERGEPFPSLNPAAGGIAQLPFALTASSPHSTCGVTHTPQGARGQGGLPTPLQLAL